MGQGAKGGFPERLLVVGTAVGGQGLAFTQRLWAVGGGHKRFGQNEQSTRRRGGGGAFEAAKNLKVMATGKKTIFWRIRRQHVRTGVCVGVGGWVYVSPSSSSSSDASSGFD